jgi:hypothetical protein
MRWQVEIVFDENGRRLVGVEEVMMLGMCFDAASRHFLKYMELAPQENRIKAKAEQNVYV